MRDVKVVRQPDGSVLVDHLSPLYADTLLRVPSLLDLEDPRVKKRLLPEVYDDEDDEEQWKKYAGTEIESLFFDRKRALAKDLETMESRTAVRFRVTIANGHVKLWLQSLNAARLALFEQHGLTQEDMEIDPADVGDEEKELALVRIHVLAHVQEVLIQS